MSNQVPVQGQREAELQAMREAEQRAMQELRANPFGGNVTASSRDEVEMLALLAGAPAAELRKAKFSDNVVAPTAAAVLDPKSVINNFTGAPVRTGAPQIRQAINQPQQGPIIQQPIVQAPLLVEKDQLELDLYKKMDLTDVYNMLESIRERLGKIEEVQRKVMDFINRVNDV